VVLFVGARIPCGLMPRATMRRAPLPANAFYEIPASSPGQIEFAKAGSEPRTEAPGHSFPAVKLSEQAVN
jgi:hypothetical protein